MAFDNENPEPAAEPIAIREAYRQIRSCPDPERARQELEVAIVYGELTPVATRAIYRQSNNTMMPSKKAISIDGKLWARIVADKQTEPFWSGDPVRLSARGGGAVDLSHIVVDTALILAVTKSHGAQLADDKRKRPNAGAPVRQHVPAIDFVMCYLRRLPEGRRNRIKNAVIATMLDAAFMKFGGKSLRQRGLDDLAAQVRRELAAPRLDDELVAIFDDLAGV